MLVEGLPVRYAHHVAVIMEEGSPVAITDPYELEADAIQAAQIRDIFSTLVGQGNTFETRYLEDGESYLRRRVDQYGLPYDTIEFHTLTDGTHLSERR